MIKKSIISLKLINSAAFTVQDELITVGLWFKGSTLVDTEIYCCALSPLSLSDADGFFTHCVSPVQKILGFEQGHIYIPSFVLSKKIWKK